MAAPDFWTSKSGEATTERDRKMRELGILNDLVGKYEAIEADIAALEKSSGQDLDENKFFETKKKFRDFELAQLMDGPYDAQAAVLGIYPGAGGEDASDWAGMLALDV